MYVLANINFQIFEVGNTVGRGISISSQPVTKKKSILLDSPLLAEESKGHFSPI